MASLPDVLRWWLTGTVQACLWLAQWF
jgi:hypothetical protein